MTEAEWDKLREQLFEACEMVGLGSDIALVPYEVTVADLLYGLADKYGNRYGGLEKQLRKRLPGAGRDDKPWMQLTLHPFECIARWFAECGAGVCEPVSHCAGFETLELVERARAAIQATKWLCARCEGEKADG